MKRAFAIVLLSLWTVVTPHLALAEGAAAAAKPQAVARVAGAGPATGTATGGPSGGPSVASQPQDDTRAASQPQVVGKKKVVTKAAAPSAAVQPAGKPAAPAVSKDTSTVIAGPPNAPDRSQVSSRAISLPQGPGKVGGLGESFSLQASTGVATFTVPIPVPPARGGVDPAFALNYKTSGGAGIAGVGWSIGAPFIARETSHGVPKYDDRGAFHPEQDRFVFGGGQLLVPLCTITAGGCANAGVSAGTAAVAGERFPSWAEGWQYFRAQVEGGYQRFFLDPTMRTWRVQEQSGNTWELGEALEDNPDDSSLEFDPERPTRIYRWLVTRQYDAEGNTQADVQPVPRNLVRYTYLHDGNTAYLSDVYYTNPASLPGARDLASFGTHVHFAYEARQDTSVSYRSGFRMQMGLRLARVDVTSKPYYAGLDGSQYPRETIRRVHLKYSGAFYQSYLETVQTEGRGFPNGAEDASGQLPEAPSNGPLLPAMRLTYSHVSDTPEIDGFERFSTVESSVVGAPAVPYGDTNVVFMDVDQDGLPDVVHADPSAYRASGLPAFGWFRNGVNGQLGRFGGATALGLGLMGADIASDIRFSAPNVGVLDIDGNGAADFLHLPPFANRARVYSFGHATLANTPGQTYPFGATWQLSGREVRFPQNQAARLQLFQESDRLRVADVNGDGQVDFVRLSGTTLEVYESLARHPGGDGLFGSGRRTGAHTAMLSEAPHVHCVPTIAPGAPARFDDPAFRFADLNGDGLVDLVHVQTGLPIRVWPGRGTGYFGTGDEPLAPGGGALQFCPSDRWVTLPYGAGAQLAFAAPEEVRLEDLNGDGLDDLVHLAPNRIRVWINRGGSSFASPRDITGVNLQRGGGLVPVRVLDLDGSGTRDLVYGDSLSGLRMRDLSGGIRPGLLVELATGLGKTTELTYSSSARERVLADAAGTPWTRTMPLVTHVVKSTVVRDNLGKVGRPDGRYVTTYSYRDPVYDTRRRDFQGFETVESRDEGDAYTQTSIRRERFLLPKCEVMEVDAGAVSPCAPGGLYREDPTEALSGLPVDAHVFGADGTPFSSKHTTYRLRTLYTGLDGRRVRQAPVVWQYAFSYDSRSVAAGSDRTPYPYPLEDVVSETPLSLNTPKPFTLMQATGSQLALNYVAIDGFGQVDYDVDYGCSFGCNQPDNAIRHSFTHTTVGADPGGWMFRELYSATLGAPNYEYRHVTTHTFDALGHRTQTQGDLSGSAQLTRFHAGGGTTAPAPASASVDGTIVLSTATYDAFGNVVTEKGPNGRCRALNYATDYADLVTSETTYVGAVTGTSLGGPTCGQTPLTVSASFDRGFGNVIDFFDVRGEHSYATYDEFGRPKFQYRPRPGSPTNYGPYVYSWFTYDLPVDDRVRPYTVVQSYTSVGSDENAYVFRGAFAYADGLGRSLVTLEDADPSAGDGSWYVAKGHKVYDAKGNVVEAYEPYFTASASPFDLAAVPTSPKVQMQYDALGRLVNQFAQDGVHVMHHDYRGFSDDLWDAADLQVGNAQVGTYVTTEADGHGRTIKVTERENKSSVLYARTTETEYLSSGEPDLIRRVTESGNVTRWMRYDTLGRMVANVDPHATGSGFTVDKYASLSGMQTVRYAWNDAGDLVGTSDARGCGVNFHHDAAGRVLAEDYSPCDSDQPVYSAPNLTTGDGTEVFTRYDSEDPAAVTAAAQGFVRNAGQYLGRAASVRDRGRLSLLSYDGRGRVVSSAAALSHPGTPSNTLSSRYAARFYVSNATYDDADRLVSQTTGARSTTLMGAGNVSTVGVTYSQRGIVKSVGGSYGTLLSSIVHGADGLVGSMTYGDLAGTQQLLTYDARKRLVNALTQRQAPALWGTGNGAYTPPVSNQTAQLTLAHTHVTYDIVDNPTLIEDLRAAAEWPAGHKPLTKAITYDGLNRATGVTYTYTGAAGNADPWQSPHAPEHAGNRGAGGAGAVGKRGVPKPEAVFPNRTTSETFAYDALGNRSSSDDDQHGFWDRSLGAETTFAASGKPYQLWYADSSVSSYYGGMTASYDAAGNTLGIAVNRPGTTGALCTPSGAICSHRYAYSWDEVGRLSRARRWDGSALGLASSPLPVATPNADLSYAYDASDMRVRTTVTSEPGGEKHTLYVFPSLELRKTSYVGAEYTLNDQVETVYLMAGGERLAKVLASTQPGTVPLASGTSAPLVLLHMQDALGSVSSVVDKASGELVESRGYRPYGDQEHSLRTSRWQWLREDYGFTGKEADVEVGLTYFGKRYLVPQTGRWLSPDPLALHVPGKADLNLYAYVNGRVFVSVDPSGLTPPDVGFAAPTSEHQQQTVGEAIVKGNDAASRFLQNDQALRGVQNGVAATTVGTLMMLAGQPQMAGLGAELFGTGLGAGAFTAATTSLLGGATTRYVDAGLNGATPSQALRSATNVDAMAVDATAGALFAASWQMISRGVFSGKSVKFVIEDPGPAAGGAAKSEGGSANGFKLRTGVQAGGGSGGGGGSAGGPAAKAPAINVQKQAGHVPGTPQYARRVEGGKLTSSFFDAKQAESATLEAWQKGKPLGADGKMRLFDFGKPVGVGPGGGGYQVQVRVSMDSGGQIHGTPWGPVFQGPLPP